MIQVTTNNRNIPNTFFFLFISLACTHERNGLSDAENLWVGVTENTKLCPVDDRKKNKYLN